MFDAADVKDVASVQRSPRLQMSVSRRDILNFHMSQLSDTYFSKNPAGSEVSSPAERSAGLDWSGPRAHPVMRNETISHAILTTNGWTSNGADQLVVIDSRSGSVRSVCRRRRPPGAAF